MANEQQNRKYRAYRVEQQGEAFRGTVRELDSDDLPAGEVTVAVAWSSLNYKDALSARGRPGVTRNYPHTPGIDASGTVVESQDERFTSGQEVIVTSFDLGMETPGGFGELIRVPADWVVPLPDGLSLREAMILGTAGFTAALALDSLGQMGQSPANGPMLVTGASGGVGSLAVALLAAQGYQVVASTGKASAAEWLTRLGASRILDRSELSEPSDRPLLKGVYGGAIDTVGGATLANLLKSIRYGGSVAACGLVGGAELNVNVFPFILRSVSLLGVDSANTAMERRTRIWQRLAGEWKPADLETLVTEVGLEDLESRVDEILAGELQGRTLVRVGAR